LQLYWPRLGLKAGSEVFVPLCGRSLDMVWLAEQGHRVIGAELSQIAIDEFFAERGLTPEVATRAGFTIKSTGAFELWCGDFFDLPPRAVAGVAGAYDRASLIAFSAAVQGTTPQS
jgi:thiopurine S-methyltransferase